MTEQELNKISYLLDSWKKFKWEPEWFGVKRINLEIFPKIISFQKSFMHKTCDGIIDAQTYEMIFTKVSPKLRDKSKDEFSDVINVHKDAVKVRLKVFDKCYSEEYVMKQFQLEKQNVINKIVISYANTYSAKIYHEMIKTKKALPHFVIDFDGVVTQFIDTSIRSNEDSNYDLSNAVLIKMINPIVTGKHDSIFESENTKTKIDSQTGFYRFTDKQLESLLTLLNKLTPFYSVPMRVTNDKSKKGVFVEEHLFIEDITNQLP